MTRRPAQRGQVVVIFALVSAAMVGLIALAIDYGFATDQHRNLQEFADHAAAAGAAQLSVSPTTAEQAAARTTSFIVFRSNLGMHLCAVPSGCGSDPQAKCAGTAIDFTADVIGCSLQSPYDSYTISIQTQAANIAKPVITAQGATLSVTVSESITTAFGTLVGSPSVSTGVTAVATKEPLRHLNLGLYAGAGVTIDDRTDVVDGDVYVEGAGFTSTGDGGLCVGASTSNAGNAIMGPGLSAPSLPYAENQTLAQCKAVTGDRLSLTGSVVRATRSINIPGLAPPPGSIATCISCSAAVANQPCSSDHRDASGTVPNSCFAPGAYSTIGVGTGIANNLNPGIYHVYGDPADACYADSSKTSCPFVIFGDNTLNANWADVKDQCWSGLFTYPCPDGFALSPRDTSHPDPLCRGSGISSLVAPGLPTVTAAAGAGSIPNGIYMVKVTAYNNMGESLPSPEFGPVVVLSPSNTLTVTIPPVPLATGYNVYVGTGSGLELLDMSSVLPTLSVTSLPSSSNAPPSFDTTSCSSGFRDMPVRPGDNHGVTFILEGKTGMSISNNSSVILSPYCSRASCPYVESGPNLNDGAFVVYAPNTLGTLDAGDSGNQLGLSGTVYMPRGQLRVVRGKLAIVPGQAIVQRASFDTGNPSSLPLIYWTDAVGALMPAAVRLSD